MSKVLNTDFSRSKLTVVVSDLHLCEAEPVHAKYPLWKKFKTAEFFFDKEFSAFLDYTQEKAKGETVELILNGDIFDFDSVMALPEDAPYRISWLERARGMGPQETKAVFKMKKIMEDHPIWVSALRKFVLAGNRAIFVIGNHDLELHFEAVQQELVRSLDLPKEYEHLVRVNEWFYISNQDTLIEHSNQYDPYCVCQNPINPFIRKHNQVEVRIPFGNLAGRYLINGMPFLNPHSDSNFLMPLAEYVSFFLKYQMRAQPLIIWTWFWCSILTLVQSFVDTLLPEVKDPLTVEDRIENIARKANATPRMVRELRELTSHPGSANPLGIARELWLDRAGLVLIAFFGIFQAFAYIKLVYSISFFWMFIPLVLFLPFFIFYARSIAPEASRYKEPKEDVMSLCSQITRTKRIIYGHTHILRHEMVGDVEHLNCGTWSPAFLDVECTRPASKKTFVWIEPDGNGGRVSKLLEFHMDGRIDELFPMDEGSGYDQASNG